MNRISRFSNSCRFARRFPVCGRITEAGLQEDHQMFCGSGVSWFSVCGGVTVWQNRPSTSIYDACMLRPHSGKIVLSRWPCTHRKRRTTNGRSSSDRWAEVNAQVQLNIRNLCIHTLLACPHKVVGRGGAGPRRAGPGLDLGAHLGKQILFMDMNNWAYVRISLSHVLMEVRMNISEY